MRPWHDANSACPTLAGRIACKRNPAHGVPAARTQRGIAAAPANGLSSSPTKIAQAIPSQNPLAVYERLLGQTTRSAKTIQKFPELSSTPSCRS